jgi:vancomycin aglycone glucosyltransferase
VQQDRRPSPPPAENEGSEMRVLLSTYGSRGDVQPLVALAVQLQALGAEVRLCLPPDEEFAQLTARAGVVLVPAFASVREWLKANMSKRTPGDITRLAAEMMVAQFEALSVAAEGCDAVLATGIFPSMAAAQAVAETRGFPYVCATYCPLWLPSPHHRPHEFPGRPHPPGVSDNRVLWDYNAQTMDALFAAALNSLRSSRGLSEIENNVRDYVFTDHPWLAADGVLGPWQRPAPLDVTQTGAWILRDERPLPADLEAFLTAGTPPVYVGFGSMPLKDSQDAARVVIESIRSHGRRALVARGWTELALIDARDDCFAIDEVNQQSLFGRVAAVIHHGGAGTTTTAARAGVPQLIVPQLADQPYWGRRVAELGIGAAHDGALPTLESLSAALRVALAPETRTRAIALAGTIRDDGATVAAKLLLDAGRAYTHSSP